MGWGSSQQIGRLRSLLTATLASQGRKQWPAMENAIANSSGCTSSGGKAVGTWAEPSLMAPGRGREVHTSSALATRQVPSASSSAPPATPLRSSTKASSGGRASWTRGLLLLPPALAALLGKWQLDRRQWKQDLLERRKRMLQADPMDIFSDGAPVPEEYQPVRATGRYDHSKAQYIGPRARSAMGTTERGALVVTPLYDPRTGRGVLVLRGWVPDAWKAGPASRGSDGEPSGHVTVAGVVRRGEDPGTFVPDNKPEAATFYYINPAELAAAVGLPQGTPLVEIIARDEEGTRMVTPGGPPSAMEVLGGRGGRVGRPQEVYPLPKSEGDLMAFSVMPRDHLNYAATWFTLSGATALLAAKALRRGRR